MIPPSLSAIDYVGPSVGAAVFVLGMSFVPEPTRRTVNTILVAGTCGVYLSGGFGLWELLYPALVTPIIFLGLRSHRYIGVAWLMHAAWDLPHHLWGNPIWPFMPTSSFGCFVFDTLIAVWFLAGAPELVPFRRDKIAAEMNRGHGHLTGGSASQPGLSVVAQTRGGFTTCSRSRQRSQRRY
jgi:hypothetical protein